MIAADCCPMPLPSVAWTIFPVLSVCLKDGRRQEKCNWLQIVLGWGLRRDLGERQPQRELAGPRRPVQAPLGRLDPFQAAADREHKLMDLRLARPGAPRAAPPRPLPRRTGRAPHVRPPATIGADPPEQPFNLTSAAGLAIPVHSSVEDKSQLRPIREPPAPRISASARPSGPTANHEIPIDRAQPPRVPSLGGFRTPAPRQRHPHDGPASETLHPSSHLTLPLA